MAGIVLSLAIDQLQYQRLGYCAVSLTNLDNDLEPMIRAGSKIEIGGSLIDFQADEAILGWAGIANDSIVYIYIDGYTLAATFTTTPPIWSPTKQAWVSADETKRYIPWGMWKDGAGNYSCKVKALEDPGEGVGRYQESVFKKRAGWLYCDGTVIDKSTSPHLSRLVYLLKKEAGADATHPFYDVDANKAKLPDIRDRHLRGMPDAGRKSGEYQADAIGPHQHNTVIGAHDHRLPDGGGANNGMSTSVGWGPNMARTEQVDLGTKRSGDPATGGAAENRVKNIAAYVLIKW